MVDYNEIAEVEHWTKPTKVSEKLKRILYVLYSMDNNVNA